MELFIVAALRALRSLFTPGMFGVFVLSILLTIAALIGFVTFSGVFFSWLGGHVQDTALAHFLPWIGTIGATMLAWALFPGIMPIIVNFFDDRIAILIERHDYPATPPARAPHFWNEFAHDVRFTLMAIALNILVIPLYFFPLLNLFVFFGLNGYLLGREFFSMVALRHIPLEEVERLRRLHHRTILTAGVALTVLATIPLVNLFAPFWGVAMMVHLYHILARTPASEVLPPYKQ